MLPKTMFSFDKLRRDKIDKCIHNIWEPSCFFPFLHVSCWAHLATDWSCWVQTMLHHLLWGKAEPLQATECYVKFLLCSKYQSTLMNPNLLPTLCRPNVFNNIKLLIHIKNNISIKLFKCDAQKWISIEIPWKKLPILFIDTLCSLVYAHILMLFLILKLTSNY